MYARRTARASSSVVDGSDRRRRTTLWCARAVVVATKSLGLALVSVAYDMATSTIWLRHALEPGAPTLSSERRRVALP